MLRGEVISWSLVRGSEILISINSHYVYELTQVQLILLSTTINSVCRV